jgi:hypothetical protein
LLFLIFRIAQPIQASGHTLRIPHPRLCVAADTIRIRDVRAPLKFLLSWHAQLQIGFDIQTIDI